MKKVDMSSEAITRRLRQTDQLRELSLSLMKARKVPVEDESNANGKNYAHPDSVTSKTSRNE